MSLVLYGIRSISTKHGNRLDDDTVRRARATLEYYLNNKDRLEDCPMLGSKRVIRALLGLDA